MNDLLAIGCGLLVFAEAVSAFEFQVNIYTNGWQRRPAVAINNSGDFVVAWSSDRLGAEYSGMYARPYDSAGIPRGNEITVGFSATRWSHVDPSVAMDENGNWVVGQPIGAFERHER